MEDEERLLDLAAAVSDGKPVDWERAEREAEDSEEQDLIHALGEISSIAEAHRSWQEPSADKPSIRPPIPIPSRWGHLEILEKVGEGSFGEVFRARDPQLDREVAVKLLRQDGEETVGGGAVLEEGRLLARVRHPNVATVYGADQREGRVGLWMEFLQGRTLSELVRLQGPFNDREAALIGLDLCRALAAVHTQGILHRDIKAQNVIRETGGRIVLMDFGIGRDLRKNPAPERSLSGTPLYLAPELLAGGEASVRSDVYSLGVLLFYLVTGSFPVRAGSISELRQAHERGDVRLLRDLRPDLPELFVRVVDRALSHNPSERFSSVGALERALSEALAFNEASSKSKSMTFSVRWRSPFLWIGATLFVILATVVLWWMEGRNKAAPLSAIPASLLVGDFENRTDEAIFDSTVRHLVGLALAQSPSIKVVPHDRIVQALLRMRKPKTTRLSPAISRELCIREAIPLWITGEIVRSGSGFNITLSAVDAESGDVRALETIFLHRAEDLISRMGPAVLKLRRHLGEPEALIRQSQRPLEQVTTGSLQALYRFSQALDLHAQGDIELAIEALEAAVRLDPQFATAHSKLAIYSGGTGSYQRAFRAAEQAYKLRNRVSERERYQISATYHLDCLQYEDALKDFQQAVILDPTNGDAYRQIAMLHANLGEPHAGIAPARKARDLSPYSVINEGVLILLLTQAGRPDEALRELTLARKRFGDDPYLYWGEGVAWQVKGDFRRAQRAFQVLAEGGTTYESHGRILLAQSLMLEDKFLQAIDILEGGLGRDNRQRFERNEAIRSLLLAKAYTLVGDTEQAQEYTKRVEALPDLPIHIKLLRTAGIHSAEVGDLERARHIMLRIEKLRELYPSALSNGASVQLQGEILAAEGRIEEAKRFLKKSSILWDDSSALRSYARLWLGLGGCTEALPSLKKMREERARTMGDFFAVWTDGAWADKAIVDCRAAGL